MSDTATTTAALSEFGVTWLTRDEEREAIIVSTASVFNVNKVQPGFFGHDLRDALKGANPEEALAAAMKLVDPKEKMPKSHDYGDCYLTDLLFIGDATYAVLSVPPGHERYCRVAQVQVNKDTGEVIRKGGKPVVKWVSKKESTIAVLVTDVTPLASHPESAPFAAKDRELARKLSQAERNAKSAKRLNGNGGTAGRKASRRISAAEAASLLG